jgi:geranylgeranyl pyrophosphate synthase
VHEDGVNVPPVGGKLLRPALCLLSAGCAGAVDLARFSRMAASMELLHLAALAHDDVVDASSLRRGKLSLNAMWNNHAAVLGGDYLVARGVALLAEYDQCLVVSNAIDCIRVMAEGELRDFGLGVSVFTEQACLALARAKTASLFAVSCSTPCCLLGSPHRDALHEFGVAIGTAFQVVDDILDLTQEEQTLGKPSCGDLSEGKKTIPILHLLESLEGAERARLEGLQGNQVEPADRAWVAERMETTGALARSEALAKRFVADACARLEALPESRYRAAMHELAEFVLVRGS